MNGRICLIVAAGYAASSAAAADPIITEFLAVNGTTLADEDGDDSDWIEIHNPGSTPLDIEGWCLTDDSGDLDRWCFPAVVIDAGAYLVVFASGKDRRDPGAPLHTSFRLGGEGEFLGLVRPNGSFAHAFESFPEQREDISYGPAAEVTTLIDGSSAADILVPSSGALGLSWTEAAFTPDGSWQRGVPAAIGYYTEGGDSTVRRPLGYWSLDGDTQDGVAGHHGSFLGGDTPTYAPGFDGVPGGALSLDGARDLVEVGPGAGMPVYPSAAYTVALWVKGPPQPDRRVYAEGSTTNTSPLFTIGTDNAGASESVDIFIRNASGATIINHLKSTLPAFDGDWHHIAWVDQNGSAALYIDGVRDGTNFSYAKQALPLDVTAFGAVLRATPCCFFQGLIDDVGVWDIALSPAEIAALASGLSPVSGSPFETLIDTDVGASMKSVRSSIYTRMEFTADDPSRFDSLVLRAQYDDGFVAYLNGDEVARRNAPATPTWTSAASGEHPDAQAVAFEEINISWALGSLLPGRNVLAVQGLNLSAADEDFLFVPRLEASASLETVNRYFLTPTPGQPNLPGFVDFVADTKFSADRGFYTSPFFVEITSETPGAVIRYTTDTTEPTETNGLVYAAPIRVSGTTLLRAAAFKEGHIATSVDTHTYIFLDQVIRQPPNPPGFPSIWHDTYPADYAMDPQICVETSSAYYEPTIRDDLLAIPTLSIVLDNAGLFGSPNGIYPNAEERGLAWERSASAELIHPDGSRGFQVNCGLRMQGGASRFPERQVKHSFRLLFKREYGTGKLRYPMFSDTPVEAFDTIILRCFFTDGWSTRTLEPRYRPDDSQYIRDVWMKDTQLDQGQHAGRNTYVHLYINGLYWGLYNPTERPDASSHAEHFGGAEEDFDVIKDKEVLDGNKTAWNAMMALANAGLASTSAYQAIQGRNPDGTRNPALPVYLDVDNLIDYMILHIFAGAEDWPHHNWISGRRRSGDENGFRFYSWDQEIVLDTLGRDRTDVSEVDSPARLYSSLRQNAEFRLRFADRVHRNFFNGGALTLEENRKRWMRRATQIDRAIVGESARWGDNRREPPFTRDVEWLIEQRVVIDEYLPEIHDITMSRFRTNGLYPSVEAPSIDRSPGRILAGVVVGLSAPAGVIHYTLDGADPRLPGGAVSPSARTAGAGAIRLDASTTIKARALQAGQWSALLEASFFVDIPLRITEIMYHPSPMPGGSVEDADEFEFIEVQNTGTETLSLAGFRLEGAVQYDFTEGLLGELPPGGIAVVVEDVLAYFDRYPSAWRPLAGAYVGRLDNAGEELRLVGPSGEPLLAVAYSSAWHPETNGGGRSLVIRDARLDPDVWSEASSWRPSLFDEGSPGLDEDPSAGGLQLPADATGDLRLDLSDAIALLLQLFGGSTQSPPCGGSPTEGGNIPVLDSTGDGAVNITDPIYLLAYLFTGGPPPVLGTGCVRIEGCPDSCR